MGGKDSCSICFIPFEMCANDNLETKLSILNLISSFEKLSK